MGKRVSLLGSYSKAPIRILGHGMLQKITSTRRWAKKQRGTTACSWLCNLGMCYRRVGFRKENEIQKTYIGCLSKSFWNVWMVAPNAKQKTN